MPTRNRKKKKPKKVGRKKVRKVVVTREYTSWTYYPDCAACGKQFRAKKSNAKYCSVRCRVRAHRERQK